MVPVNFFRRQFRRIATNEVSFVSNVSVFNYNSILEIEKFFFGIPFSLTAFFDVYLYDYVNIIYENARHET